MLQLTKRRKQQQKEINQKSPERGWAVNIRGSVVYSILLCVRCNYLITSAVGWGWPLLIAICKGGAVTIALMDPASQDLFLHCFKTVHVTNFILVRCLSPLLPGNGLHAVSSAQPVWPLGLLFCKITVIFAEKQYFFIFFSPAGCVVLLHPGTESHQQTCMRAFAARRLCCFSSV